MKADALQVVSLALSQCLAAALLAAGVPSPKVVVAPPGAAGADAHLVLYPYKILASQAQRNEVRTVLTGDPARPVHTFDNALPLDVHFLLAIGEPQADPAQQMENYRLLGFAIQALQLDPFLMGPALGGDVVRVTLEPVNSEEMNRIWALFPATDYRLSVSYLLSPVWIDPEPAQAGPRVLDDQRLVGVRG